MRSGMLFCALACVAAFAQPAGEPAFEAASVKLATGSGRPSMKGGPGTTDEGRIAYANVTLADALARADDVRTYQVSGPGWLSFERYQIDARIPPGTTKQQFQRMLQNLLAQRFHLALHREIREFAGYELVVGKGGSKLKPSVATGDGTQEMPDSPPKIDANGFPILTAPGLVLMEGVRGKAVVTYLTGRAQPISALADRISREFRLPVVDKTGLSGAFDFTLEFAPQPPGALPSAVLEEGPGAFDDSAPNLITAVQQQLGLKLLPRKIALEVLVIDRADRVPVEN